MVVTIAFHDNPRNGHNTLHITGEVSSAKSRRRRDIEAGGLMPDEIRKVFPELAEFLPWCGCSQDGPMHYLANTIYLAGDRDHHGKRKGEVLRSETVLAFGDNPIEHKLKPSFIKFLQDAASYDLEVIGINHDNRETYGTKYTFGGYGSRWHECPFNTQREALSFLAALQTCSPRFVTTPTAWSEGKDRDLAAARSVAIWPEATDEQLTAEPAELRAMLEARLPDLLARFRSVVEGAGFAWEAS
jgi:hypothetical protein